MTTTSTDSVARLYRATTTPQLVHVPRLSFLCVDGHGGPSTSPAYAAAVQAFYAVSYSARRTIRKESGESYRVSPLEGLWWADDLSTFATGDTVHWRWTMMVRQPDAVTAGLVERLIDDVAAGGAMPMARELRLSAFEEGAAAQVLHVGPYTAEAPTIARLHDFIKQRGFTFDGHRHKHHEIYLGDPRRAAPERLRTIIRQPYTT
jgi:hypothetical protein